jgi:hypothetical protein
MNAFRLLLAVMLIGVLIYTGITVSKDGLNLFPHFFGAIAEMGWQGQFNTDFTMFLTLSALWTAWRNGFSGGGIALAVAAFFLGIVFLSAYLLYLSNQTNGDIKAMLLGVHARA